MFKLMKYRNKATLKNLILCGMALLIPCGSSALADWSSDPLINTVLADRVGEQTQVKIVLHPDGGAYVSWFDNSAGGYDVYLQRLDANGAELWPHNGVLLANRSFSSTQDYDLDIDAGGNALLAFRDDRSGSTQITATRVSPTGTQLWGATGVQVTSGGAFVAAPKIAGTTDGAIVVAWTNNGDVVLQKLNSSGVVQWGAGVLLTDPAISISASDLDASDAGSVIISVVRGFLGPKSLLAQKISPTGATLWGVSLLPVFDGGSLQTANFPQFVPDGNGGAVFGWYGVGPLQCYAQHILANGTEKFPHDGVVASTLLSQLRVNPSVAYDATTDSIYLFWVETNTLQSQHGVYGQKFSSAGIRQWTDTGVVVVPVGGADMSQVRTIPQGGGATVCFVQALSFGNERVKAARYDAAGNPVWTPGIVDVSSVASGKSRLEVALRSDDTAIVGWKDSRNDFGDIFGQNLNLDGSLGVSVIPCPGDITPVGGNGTVNIDDLVAVLNAFGPCLGCAADITPPGGNGVVNIDDLVAVLNAFGACP